MWLGRSNACSSWSKQALTFSSRSCSCRQNQKGLVRITIKRWNYLFIHGMFIAPLTAHGKEMETKDLLFKTRLGYKKWRWAGWPSSAFVTDWAAFFVVTRKYQTRFLSTMQSKRELKTLWKKRFPCERFMTRQMGKSSTCPDILYYMLFTKRQTNRQTKTMKYM